MKIFINIGSGAGGDIHRFYKDVTDAADWRIICFEPLQFDRLISCTNKYNNIEHIEAAVAIEDGELLIYPSYPYGISSTMVLGKSTGTINYTDPITVNGIDFIKWFKDNIKDTDFVIISMNIEGGEYILLPKLHEIISKIDGLWLKLHHHKFERQQRHKFTKIYIEFAKKIKEYKAFIFCDLVDKHFDFKWFLEQVYNVES